MGSAKMEVKTHLPLSVRLGLKSYKTNNPHNQGTDSKI